MHQNIPKQFLSVNDRPIIVYTLEAFQNHPSIHDIVVVCLEGWDIILSSYCKQFSITKVTSIVAGGDTGQASIYNGLLDIAKRYQNNDIVLIHDAIRPMVSADIISDCIRVCAEYGNAITAVPCNTAMLRTNDSLSSSEIVIRDNLRATQTPQAVPLGKLLQYHSEALIQGITKSVATCTMLIELGHDVYFSAGSEKNIKITTVEDIDIFKALLCTSRMDWLK